MPWLSIPTVPARQARRAVPMLMMAFALAGVGQGPADADAALRRTRDRLLADLARMPRYTCVQTINRQYFRPRSRGVSPSTLMAEPEYQAGKLVQWDRLRLEVAIVDGSNVYSWVGAPRFEGDTLEQLAGGGPLSSGDFGPFLNSILSSATITFKSEERAGQKRLLTYSYDMPVDRSGYELKCKGGWVRTAYNGTLVIDPEAGDLMSLTVRTTELPESDRVCQASSEVEYGRTQIHDRMVLIPRQTRLITMDRMDRKNSETRSLTTYSNCREYSSQSKLFFEGPPAGVANSLSPAQQSPSSTLPAKVHFRARIVTPIDSNTAAIGDAIEAVLLSPIRGQDRREWAPAGSRLHGRLLSLTQSMSPSFFQLLVQFESIDLNGRTVPFRASPDLSGFGNAVDPFEPEMSVIPDAATLENVFIFRKDHLHLRKLEWGWTTSTTLPELESQPKSFPAGLPFRARIVTPIDSDTAVGGDPIQAVLLSPIRSKDGQESAPAGARLYGHLVALKQYTLKSHDYVEVLVRFEFIELDGNAVPLRAAPDLSGSVFALDSPYGEDLLVIPGDAIRENLFLFVMKHLHLENFDWDWTTLPAKSLLQSSPATFPAGVHFRARIVTSIDLNKAGPGDPIEAVLLSPIPSKDGREWAPAGARLRGRLLGLKEKQLRTQSIFEVLMQFDSIELKGSGVPLEAAPDLAGPSRFSTAGGTIMPEVSVVPDAALRMNVFIFLKQHSHLKNFEWGWTTLPAQQSPP